MISAYFIKRPKSAIVLSLFFILAGSLTLKNMPIAEYPEIAPPQVQVRVMYPGASAQDIVDSVAAPIEIEMNSLEHLLYYSSTSSITGSYQLSLIFDYGTDGDIAQVNVQNAISRAEPFLPADVKQLSVAAHQREIDRRAARMAGAAGDVAVEVEEHLHVNIGSSWLAAGLAANAVVHINTHGKGRRCQ